ncbi:MAG: dTDP-glucose 4,6-dehydratase [Candidatus Omnitrophica bacterium]|nr:dTDP-glucose 4,6-dehydratase [Candidatus Omnitrophota bacterium]
MKRILVTGGAGFIGSNFIRFLLKERVGAHVTNLDKLTYAGNRENLRELEGNPCYRFIQGDIADPGTVNAALKECDTVVHFAAESHVDRSIRDASAFLQTNVLGTHNLLEAAKNQGIQRFIHISTDEVYGSLERGTASESSPLSPSNPYAASKAASDHLVRSYYVTFGLPALVIRGTNNFGPYQFPEKFIPLMITQALRGDPIPVYGDGKYTREWIYVADFCSAILLLLEKGAPGEIYNAGSGDRRENLAVVETVLSELKKPKTLVKHVADRLGHDRRYAIDSSKIRKLGWKPASDFETAIRETIRWYRDNPRWWNPLTERAKLVG